jgi:hypothetical protein
LPDGTPFSLSGFDAAFRLATTRGSQSQIVGYAQKSSDNTHIVCAIPPDMTLPTNTSLVYDVEIRKQQDTPYSLVYTLLTGSVTLTDQVTFIPLQPPLQAPGVPTSVLATNVSQTNATISWNPPSTGGPVESYTVSYALASSPNTIIASVAKTGSEFTHTFTNLVAASAYIFYVSASNNATVGTPQSTSVSVTTLPNPPLAPQDFTVTEVTDTTATITWTAPEGGGHSGYIARLDNNPVASIGPTETTYTFETLTPNTQYTLSLVAFNTGGSSPAVSQTITTQA